MSLLSKERFRAYLELMRPANVITAHADILVGVAASGGISLFNDAVQSTASQEPWIPSLLWLLLSTTGLYAGGVVLNDFFDADLDKIERPERAIPSGRVQLQEVMLLGAVLLAIGILAAFQSSVPSGVLALIIGGAIVLYNAKSKHHVFWGPLNMGMCRGLNLLLGVSMIPSKVTELWFIALLPIVYIAAITLISRGEVHGGSRKNGFLAVALIALVIIGALLLGLLEKYEVLIALPFLIFFSARVLPPFIQAAREPNPEKIRTAVMVGVLSLILFDGVLAAGFSGWIYGLIVLMLFPISRKIGQLFAVT